MGEGSHQQIRKAEIPLVLFVDSTRRQFELLFHA